MEIELTTEESAAVQAALRSHLEELRSEIHHTDDRDFKRDLKTTREALASAVAKLDEAGNHTDLRDERGVSIVRVVSVWWAEDLPL